MKPEHLCHYTNTDGLVGILTTQKLWATNAEFLNDTTEVTHGLQLFLEELKVQAPEDFRNRGILAAFLDTIERGVRMFSPCVFCLSSLPDDLSQWRAYADDARGFAIFFDGTALEKTLEAFDGARFLVLSVTYHSEEKQRIAREFIRNQLPDLTNIELSFGGLPVALLKCFEAAWNLSASFKVESFRHEAEWRLVCQAKDPRRLKFRIRNNLAIPYYELQPKEKVRLPIHKIAIGPNHPYPDEAVRSVQLLLEKGGYTDGQVQIEKCSLPYRSR